MQDFHILLVISSILALRGEHWKGEEKRAVYVSVAYAYFCMVSLATLRSHTSLLLSIG